MIVEASLGGLGRHVAELSEELAARGHKVHVLYCPIRMDHIFAAFLKDARHHGIETTAMEMGREVGPKDIATVMKVRRWIKEHGPFDIIHGHSSKGGALARLAAPGDAVKLYTPGALVTLSPTISGRKRALFKFIEKWLGRIGDGLIAVSKEERDHAVEIGIPADKITVIPNGMAEPNFAPRENARAEIGAAPGDLVFGYVGRMVDQKAPDVLVKAFAQAFGRDPRARLAMVGDGPLMEAAQVAAEEGVVEDRVIFFGHYDARRVMAGFDVFALPSRYEGHPYVLIEAIFLGLPIVASDVSGVPCMVDKGVNGLLVPHDDIAALATAMKRMRDDVAFRESAARASLKMRESFTVAEMTNATENMYRRLLHRKRGTRKNPGAWMPGNALKDHGRDAAEGQAS